MEKMIKTIQKTKRLEDLKFLYGSLANAYIQPRENATSPINFTWPDMTEAIKYIRQGIRFMWKSEAIPLTEKCIYIRTILDQSGVIGKAFLENSFVKVNLSDPETETPKLKDTPYFTDLRLVSSTRLSREFLNMVEEQRPDLIEKKFSKNSNSKKSTSVFHASPPKKK